MIGVRQIIDVSGWHKSNMSVGGGTRDKLVFRKTKFGKVYYMVKSFQKDVGELRSEVCASNLGRVTGFPVQRANFCKVPNFKSLSFEDSRCVLIRLDITRQQDRRRNLLKEDLLHGMDIISLLYPDFQNLSDETLRRKEYTLNKTLSALRNYVVNNPSARDLWFSFYEMIVFDALIGGTDRHYRNWGVLVDAKSRAYTRFAPAFDNGISLLWNKAQHKTFLDKGAVGGRFIRNAKSAFRKDGGGQYSLLEVCTVVAQCPEITKSMLRTIKNRLCSISDAQLKKAVISNVPHSADFESNREILGYVYFYVKMRLQILKELFHTLV